MIVRSLALAAIVAGLAAPACGSDSPSLPASSELVGTIVDISDEDGAIDSFTLRSESDAYEIFIADDVDYGFDLHHLFEHESMRQPVRCLLEERGDRIYALTIEDA